MHSDDSAIALDKKFHDLSNKGTCFVREERYLTIIKPVSKIKKNYIKIKGQDLSSKNKLKKKISEIQYSCYNSFKD